MRLMRPHLKSPSSLSAELYQLCDSSSRFRMLKNASAAGTAHRLPETGWSYFLCAGSSDQSPYASVGSDLPAVARWDGGIVASQFLISTWLST